MMKRIREVSPHLKARIAGVLFLLVILTAAFTEFFVPGRLGFTADLVVGVIEISGIIVVTLLFYDIFRTVNRRLSLLAASFNFVGLTLELLQFNPRGRDDRNRISRTLFPPDGPPPLPVNLPASNSGRTDGIRRSGLAGLSVTEAYTLPVPLQSGPASSGKLRCL
jgi:hypothetical protein